MSLYIDTSCLIKLLTIERDSGRVHGMVQAEDEVVVSALTRLESLLCIQSWLEAGLVTSPGAVRLVAEMNTLLHTSPFSYQSCSAAVWEEAERQILPLDISVYCRTLDRLHLAALRVLGLNRLFTNDDTQAHAATAMGIEVILPR